MCDYSRRMENSQGDLTDIIRSRSLAGPLDNASIPPSSPNGWQSQSDPSAGDVFTDPLTDSGEPILHEYTRTSFLDSSETSGDGSAQKMALWEGEEKRPSGSLFSRMPLTTLGNGKGSALTKRRKSQAKKVVCIPAPTATSGKPSGEVVPSDLWAWRKYGQKPIKGSPYPRGYYRCSSSKGCPARKQVERSRTDPNMLVITYTSEHNHPWPTQRNALAGSTRSQPSKTNNSSSTSENSPHNHPKQFITSIKEEPKECTTLVVKEEAYDEMENAWIDLQDYVFDQVFNESIDVNLMLDQNYPDDFFTDLAELEPDPMNLIIPKEFFGDKVDQERNTSSINNKAMNTSDMFVWEERNTFGELKRDL